MSVDKLFVANKKVSLDELMKNEWTEVLEFGFGRKSVLYAKKDERLIYDELKSEIILKYSVAGTYKGD